MTIHEVKKFYTNWVYENLQFDRQSLSKDQACKFALDLLNETKIKSAPNCCDGKDNLIPNYVHKQFDPLTAKEFKLG